MADDYWRQRALKAEEDVDRLAGWVYAFHEPQNEPLNCGGCYVLYLHEQYLAERANDRGV